MKAAYILEPGPPDNVVYGDLDVPPVGDHDLLVRTTAVAVNPIDTYIRNGANFWELPRPFVVGCDLAGVVEKVGPHASRFAVGDRVWGSNQGLLGRQGTFAEYCAVHEHWLYPIPENVTDKTAAACALVGITAHLGLFREAGLREGETVFLNGGSGGVGSMVIQMAKAVGAHVITTAGSDDKVRQCERLGADVVLNYRRDDVRKAVTEHAPQGVHVAWETQREPDLDFLIGILAERGRLVLMAGRDARPAFPVGPFYVKECSIHGFAMFKGHVEEQRAAADAINDWMSTGKLVAQIGAELPLSETAAAHRLQEDNTLRQAGTLAGKIILTP